jgi:hypothetical protein
VRSRYKCGRCPNCLNPQRKQACLEKRQEQLTGSQAQGLDPIKPKTTKPAAAADDPFVRTLRAILAAQGGVAQAKHAPVLLNLIKRAHKPGHRSALLSVLQRSSPEVQRLAVQNKALLELQGWLAASTAERKVKPVLRMLACLTELPVTIAALQHPCELGKLVGKLRKAEGLEEAHAPAKALVARWKALVDSLSGAAPRLVAAQCRDARCRRCPCPPLPRCRAPCIVAVACGVGVLNASARCVFLSPCPSIKLCTHTICNRAVKRDNLWHTVVTARTQSWARSDPLYAKQRERRCWAPEHAEIPPPRPAPPHTAARCTWIVIADAARPTPPHPPSVRAVSHPSRRRRRLQQASRLPATARRTAQHRQIARRRRRQLPSRPAQQLRLRPQRRTPWIRSSL